VPTDPVLTYWSAAQDAGADKEPCRMTEHKRRVLIDPEALAEAEIPRAGLVGDDLLIGVSAIRQYLYGNKKTDRQVYLEIEQGIWPYWKRPGIAGRVCASKQALREHYRTMTRSKPTW
jgi:hypothetical protein